MDKTSSREKRIEKGILGNRLGETDRVRMLRDHEVESDDDE